MKNSQIAYKVLRNTKSYDKLGKKAQLIAEKNNRPLLLSPIRNLKTISPTGSKN